MEDGLTGVHAGIEDETEVPVGVLGGKRLSSGNNLGEQRRVTLSELGNIAVARGLGHDKQVHRSLRLKRVKGNQPLVLEHDRCWQLARDDALEHCWLGSWLAQGHAKQSRARG